MKNRFPFENPLLLGFDALEDLVARAARGSDGGFPPYDIRRLAEEPGLTRVLRITLAVAGFPADALSVTVEGNQLIVRGRSASGEPPRDFIHRGIANRQFQRIFVLADGLDVIDAVLDNGFLHIEIEEPPEETRVRDIPIRSAGR